MKKLVLTLTLTLACAAAFAQGKVKFVNDSLHLVYYTTDVSKVVPGDLAGAVVPLTAGASISVDLFAGTSSSALQKVTTTTLTTTGTQGTWLGVNVSLPWAAGSGQFFQIYAYSTSAGSYDAAKAGSMLYYGDSGLFTATSSSTINYNSLVISGNPSFSTWAAGTQAEDSVLTGAKGALSIQANVPEPTSLALLGLGAAGLMIFRRRK